MVLPHAAQQHSALSSLTCTHAILGHSDLGLPRDAGTPSAGRAPPAGPWRRVDPAASPQEPVSPSWLRPLFRGVVSREVPAQARVTSAGVRMASRRAGRPNLPREDSPRLSLLRGLKDAPPKHFTVSLVTFKILCSGENPSKGSCFVALSDSEREGSPLTQESLEGMILPTVSVGQDTSLRRGPVSSNASCSSADRRPPESLSFPQN